MSLILVLVEAHYDSLIFRHSTSRVLLAADRSVPESSFDNRNKFASRQTSPLRGRDFQHGNVQVVYPHTLSLNCDKRPGAIRTPWWLQLELDIDGGPQNRLLHIYTTSMVLWSSLQAAVYMRNG